jgi:hypothetical protein
MERISPDGTYRNYGGAGEWYTSLAVGADGNIWFTTNGEGLGRFIW